MSTAKSRLATYRSRATKYAADHPDHKHYIDWRHWVSRQTKVPSCINRDREDPKTLYVDSFAALGWREIGDAHDIVNLRHTGWYADNNRHNLIKGYVLQLPARNGEERYVPATYSSEYDTATVHLRDMGPDKEQAARDADGYAERQAKSERDFDAQESAKVQIEEAREEIHRINKEALAVLKEVKDQSFTPAVCSMLKGGIEELLAERRAQFKRITKLKDDYWSAVPQ